jgi:tetratricopeptide (TPR) repeat protein
MGTTLGVAYRGLKKPEKALEYLQKAIAEQPSYAPAYSVMSMVLRDAGNLEGARDVLVRGNEATRGESAEIHYLLGLTYLDLNDVPAARRHADEAYRRGYPLPGLRDRLQRAVQP